MALANILRGVQGGQVRNPAYGPPGNQAVMYGAGANDPYMAQQAANPNGPANTALGQFGLSLPQNPNPFILFNNNPGGFAQNHPRVAGALDNAAGVLANMGPTSMSAGDNISNVARGLMGNRAMHQQYLMQQYQAPFQLASQIAGLQQAEDVHATAASSKAHIDAITAGLPEAQRDAHVIAGAHAAYWKDVGAAQGDRAEALKYKNDPTLSQIESENRFRVVNGLEEYTPEETQQRREALTKSMAIAAAAGKKDVKKATPGKASGTYKIDPRDKQAHDDALKTLAASQKELSDRTKMKTGEAARAEALKPTAQIQAEIAAKQAALTDIQTKIQKGNSPMAGPSQKPPVKQPQWNMQTGRYE
jgi:hypothetical protein